MRNENGELRNKNGKFTKVISMKRYFSFLNSHFSTPSGFTLIELVIAIALIGILAAGLLQLIDPVSQLRKASDAERKSDLAQLQRALELYYQDNGKYPDSNNYEITVLGSGGQQISLQWGTAWTPYMAKLPADPKPPRTYIYYSNQNGQAYYLYANLERGAADPQACNGGNACTNAPTTCGGGAVCNFGLTSPNVTP